MEINQLINFLIINILSMKLIPEKENLFQIDTKGLFLRNWSSPNQILHDGLRFVL